MSKNKEDIIFNDPELDEELAAETDEEPQKPVELPETRPRWSPAGAFFPGAELAEDSPRFCQDGKMVDQLSNETVDPDSMNFLLAKQKEVLEPDEAGPIPVGGSFRSPDYEALDEVLQHELACPFCNEKFSEDDCDPKELGSLVSYGGTIYHWSCLALWMLILAKGHTEIAAKRFFVDIRDLRAIKSSYRAIPWGRLGWRREGSQ
ncbi:MAG: hypothetical protein PHS80_02625 [Methanothrix sp.]|nr:hypothetical protein [Methanothrix sp.]